MPLDAKESIDNLVEGFIQPLRTPITATCKWYSYYYLSEIQEIEQADFELAKLTQKLHGALFDYGVYACYRELANKQAHYEFLGTPIQQVNDYLNSGVPESYRKQLIGYGVTSSRDAMAFEIAEAIKNEIEASFSGNKYGINPQQIRKFILTTVVKHPMGSSPADITSTAKEWEEDFNVFSEPREALQLASVLFGTELGTDDNIRGNSGWVTGFGGEAWEAVAETTMKYYEVTRKAFIDMMFQMEHNNGNLLNKTTLNATEEVERVHPILQDRHPGIVSKLTYPSTGFPNKYSSNDVYSVIMPEILDMVRQERMVTPLKIASAEDSRIGRWAKRAGVL